MPDGRCTMPDIRGHCNKGEENILWEIKTILFLTGDKCKKKYIYEKIYSTIHSTIYLCAIPSHFIFVEETNTFCQLQRKRSSNFMKTVLPPFSLPNIKPNHKAFAVEGLPKWNKKCFDIFLATLVAPHSTQLSHSVLRQSFKLVSFYKLVSLPKYMIKGEIKMINTKIKIINTKIKMINSETQLINLEIQMINVEIKIISIELKMINVEIKMINIEMKIVKKKFNWSI